MGYDTSATGNADFFKKNFFYFFFKDQRISTVLNLSYKQIL